MSGWLTGMNGIWKTSLSTPISLFLHLSLLSLVQTYQAVQAREYLLTHFLYWLFFYLLIHSVPSLTITSLPALLSPQSLGIFRAGKFLEGERHRSGLCYPTSPEEKAGNKLNLWHAAARATAVHLRKVPCRARCQVCPTPRGKTTANLEVVWELAGVRIVRMDTVDEEVRHRLAILECNGKYKI